MRLPVRTGDLFCDDIDVDAYRRECRVTLFPELWNVWRIWVSADVARDDIAEAVEAFCAEAVESAGGKIHDFEITIGDVTPPGGVPRAMPQVFGPRNQNQTWQTNCPGWFDRMRLAPGSFRAVAARFVVRNVRVSLASWPAVKLLPGTHRTCPENATILLESTWRPIAGETVPDAPKLFPDWSWPSLPTAGDVAKTAASVLVPVVLVAGGAVALMVLMGRRSLRKSQAAGVTLMRMRSAGRI